MDTLWSVVAVHLWQCSLVLALVFLLGQLLRRAPARMLHLLWLTALIKLFLPLPVLGGLTHALLAPLLPGATADSPTSAGLDLAALWTPALLVVEPEEAGRAWFDVPTALTVAWLVGAAWLLASWIRRAIAVSRSLHSDAAVADARLASRLADALAESAIPPDRVILSAADRGPCVVGLLRPSIVLPRRLVEGLETVELRAILLHEEAHRRRRDPLLGLLQQFAVLGFFYYPLLWPLLRRLQASREMACDEYVLSYHVPAETYTRALARAVGLCLEPALAPAIAAGGSPSLLRQRFQHIAGYGKEIAMRRHHLALVACCLLVLVGSFAPVTPTVGVDAAGDDLQFVELGRLRDHNLPISLSFTDTPVDSVFRAIAAASGVRIEFDGALPDRRITVNHVRAPLRLVLEEISRQTAVRYRVADPTTLWVGGGDAPEPLPSHDVLLIQDGVVPPELISKVTPRYPLAARKERATGRVMLQAVIQEDGTVHDVQVLKSTGPGHGLEEAAIDAVRQWTYEPATLDGQPVAVYLTISVDFTLK